MSAFAVCRSPLITTPSGAHGVAPGIARDETRSWSEKLLLLPESGLSAITVLVAALVVNIFARRSQRWGRAVQLVASRP